MSKPWISLYLSLNYCIKFHRQITYCIKFFFCIQNHAPSQPKVPLQPKQSCQCRQTLPPKQPLLLTQLQNNPPAIKRLPGAKPAKYALNLMDAFLIDKEMRDQIFIKSQRSRSVRELCHRIKFYISRVVSYIFRPY